MFLCLFIDFSLAEQMRLFKMLSGKKQFIEFHGEISPFLFLRYAFVVDLAIVQMRNWRLLLMKNLIKGEAVIWANELIKNWYYY